jgi:hypothetical protein
MPAIQDDSEEKVNIVRDDSIGHCQKKKVQINMCQILNGCRTELFEYTNEKH